MRNLRHLQYISLRKPSLQTWHQTPRGLRSFSALRSTASWLARPSRVIRRGWQLGVIRCFYTLKTGVSLREEVSSSPCAFPPPLFQASLWIPQNDLLPWVSSFLSLKHPSELKKIKEMTLFSNHRIQCLNKSKVRIMTMTLIVWDFSEIRDIDSSNLLGERRQTCPEFK